METTESFSIVYSDDMVRVYYNQVVILEEIADVFDTIYSDLLKEISQLIEDQIEETGP